MELNKLLRPQKIVIVGATERETMAGFASRMFLEQCRERMEDLYLVSLKNDRVFGVPCYRKISDIPGKIDLAVICTAFSTMSILLGTFIPVPYVYTGYRHCTDSFTSSAI